MTTELIICQFNMGSNINDYLLRLGISDSDDPAKLEEAYNQAQTSSHKILAELNADVYCLQEVIETAARPLIRDLSESFLCIHLNTKYPDTCILLKKKRFDLIENCSRTICDYDTAILTAFDTILKKTLLIASAHIPGFDLSIDPIDDKDARRGDEYAFRLAQVIHDLKGDIKILGADVNADPEKWSLRFKNLMRHDLVLHKLGKKTARNSKEPAYRDREIDFIFLYEDISFWKRLTQPATTTLIEPIPGIDLDTKDNASDHIPIKARILFPH